jgi:ribose transport system ATP-binding protein
MTLETRMENISKAFGGVKALDQVDLVLRPAEVHALVGENGAGKSTLMKILAGVLQPDSGKIQLAGQPVRFTGPKDARQKGISCIFQELSLFSNLSVMENLMFSACWGESFYINWKSKLQKSREVLARLGVYCDPRVRTGDLSIADQQMVEVAKALVSESQIIIMDEPTSSLAPQEVVKLFGVIHELVGQGKSIVYISHKMDEIFEIAGQITIMKDGKRVITAAKDNISRDEVVKLMIGRELNQIFPEPPVIQTNNSAISIKDLNTQQIHNLSLEVRKGEILGLAGLEGQGQRELLRSIFTGSYQSGSIKIDEQEYIVNHPVGSFRMGLGMVPGDRKNEGLILDLSIRENIILSNLSLAGKFGLIHNRDERQIAADFMTKLRIKAPSMENPVSCLSGGNQQKVVLAKILATGAKILLLEEPTRGVDIGAKCEIYNIIDELAKNGIAVILYSTEMIELIGLCHRIAVMYQGTITRLLDRDLATEESIMRAALGMKPEEVMVEP